MHTRPICWPPNAANAHRQIRTSTVSPERLPLRHGVSLNPQRRGGLETSHYYQANSSWHSRPTGWSQSRFPGPSRSVQPVQEGPTGIREESEAHREGEPGALGRHRFKGLRGDYDRAREPFLSQWLLLAMTVSNPLGVGALLMFVRGGASISRLERASGLSQARLESIWFLACVALLSRGDLYRRSIPRSILRLGCSIHFMVAISPLGRARLVLAICGPCRISAWPQLAPPPPPWPDDGVW